MSSNENLLQGRRALVVGVANERSLAWGIAEKLSQAGAEIAFTFQNEALERRVRPLAESLNSTFVEACDVSKDESIDDLFGKLRQKWDRLDILVHSVAFANREDLDGRFVDTSREGFRIALDVSTYSLVVLARRAEPLMKNLGGSILTLTNHGSQKVIPNYNVMGVAKAALEASVRYLANDFGESKIRINAISAGPVQTLAASGTRNFRDALDLFEKKAPLHEIISSEDVGELAAFLCSSGAKHVTGTTLYVDSGAHIMGA